MSDTPTRPPGSDRPPMVEFPTSDEALREGITARPPAPGPTTEPPLAPAPAKPYATLKPPPAFTIRQAATAFLRRLRSLIG